MGEARFSQRRLRRLRQSVAMRAMVADVSLSPTNLMYPMFVGEMRERREVGSMPGVYQWPVEAAVERIGELARAGLGAFILFGVIDSKHKDACGGFAGSAQAPVNQVLARVRQGGLEVVLAADLCFCEYTEHGHCGVLAQGGDERAGIVDNDATLAMLGPVAVAQAAAGADIVAPSGMMDGQVGVVRRALDEAGYTQVAVMSYAVKYASSFYGPFREAGGGGMRFGDRQGYQMDYRRAREWRSELEADLAEGADMVMVKPAMAYLDVLGQMRQECDVPIAAYQVSGEYAMLHAAAARGWLELEPTVLESTYAIRRAGADVILTYFAPQLLEWL